jgi:subtilisin family serine protease
VNISAAFTGAIPTRDDVLGRAIDHAAGHGVIVVAAAGNDRRAGGSPLVSHQWVIPVAAADAHGHPLATSNVGASIGRNGVSAPGTGIISLTPDGGYGAFGGSSAAAALVSGAIALAWSGAPDAPAERVRAAFSRRSGRPGMVPQPLDAVRTYHHITGHAGGTDGRTV